MVLTNTKKDVFLFFFFYFFLFLFFSFFIFFHFFGRWFIEERETDVFYPLTIHRLGTSSCLEASHHSHSQSRGRGCLLYTLKISVHGKASKSGYISCTVESMLPIPRWTHDLGESEEPSFFCARNLVSCRPASLA